MLGRGLFATAQLWAPLETAHAWVVWAAQILANHVQADGAAVATAYRSFINELLAYQSTPELEPFVTHFYKVSMSYWRGLFWCYDVADLPRTNNDLEQYFGSARYLERRATGRKRPTAAMVVRGAVRVVAAVATQTVTFQGADLQPRDVQAWRRVRAALEARHETRRQHHRFRRDPQAYLATLEAQVLE